MAAKKKTVGRTASEGQTLLLAPDHITAASVNGEQYPVVDGYIEVPKAHAHELLSVGFSLPTEPEPELAPEPDGK